MFQHMFSSMTEVLDGIIEQYPEASDQERVCLHEQLHQLKKLSDTFVEHWLAFEEKFTEFNDHLTGLTNTVDLGKPLLAADPAAPAQTAANAMKCSESDLHIPDEAADMMNKGQGYYKLFMFHNAAPLFQSVLSVAPECNMARLFLGMSEMHLQHWSEAERHFGLLIRLSHFPKWLALGYNALGCIQAVKLNMTHAEQLFQKAYEIYPAFADSLNNLQSLKSTQSAPGHLSLYFGSTELCCL
ncbi:hypothetical protein [Paenibacillus sp. HB172176]|uniref:tetratricopeptide repeat protein n=1 Tax=Paenibacillus sp. HB172176 TaxID=2493690 RepID=UPI00143ADB5E|nr:hypothetical protein [Paenibacillus sp. HB172176]